jgi:hypothetical protein
VYRHLKQREGSAVGNSKAGFTFQYSLEVSTVRALDMLEADAITRTGQNALFHIRNIPFARDVESFQNFGSC